MSKITVPYGETDIGIFAHDLDESIDPSTLVSSYVARDPIDAYKHVALLVSLISDMIRSAILHYDAAPAFGNFLCWHIETMQTLMDLHTTWKLNHDLHISIKDTVSSIHSSLAVLFFGMDVNIPSYITRKAFLLLSDVCTALLAAAPHQRKVDNDGHITSSLSQLADFCGKSEVLCQHMRLHLVPILLTIRYDEDLWSRAEPEFRVCTCNPSLDAPPNSVQKASQLITDCILHSDKTGKHPSDLTPLHVDSIDLQEEEPLDRPGKPDDYRSMPARKRRKVQEPTSVQTVLADSINELLDTQILPRAWSELPRIIG